MSRCLVALADQVAWAVRSVSISNREVSSVHSSISFILAHEDGNLQDCEQTKSGEHVEAKLVSLSAQWLQSGIMRIVGPIG